MRKETVWIVFVDITPIWFDSKGLQIEAWVAMWLLLDAKHAVKKDRILYAVDACGALQHVQIALSQPLWNLLSKF